MTCDENICVEVRYCSHQVDSQGQTENCLEEKKQKSLKTNYMKRLVALEQKYEMKSYRNVINRKTVSTSSDIQILVKTKMINCNTSKVNIFYKNHTNGKQNS